MVGEDLRRYTFDEGRLYTDGDNWYPSVSTVLDIREDPPGLRKHKQRTSQQEQDWIKFYTQNRGTLVHYEILSDIDPDLEWTEDEQSSEECLRGQREHEETGLTGDYETWNQFEQDLEWAKSAWDLVLRVSDIEPERAKGVEVFVSNDDYEYAGQFDLLYIDSDGNYRLSDIKTSKMVYDKHLLQLASYEHAVDVSVDLLEIIRINPNTETWEISTSDTWLEDRKDLWNSFVELRQQYEQEKIDELKSKIDDEN